MVIPNEAPVMTLPGVTLFPGTLLPLHIFEPRYRRMLAAVLRSHRMLVVAMQRPGCPCDSPAAVAGLGFVRVCVDHDDGTSHLVLQGHARVELTEWVRQHPFPVSRIRPLLAAARDSVAIDALMAKVRDLVAERIQLGFASSSTGRRKLTAKIKQAQALLTVPEIIGCLEKRDDPDQVADLVSSALLTRASQKQIILETVEVEPRLKHLIHFLMGEISLRQRKAQSEQ
ncbi:MAG TPA: LON peptidase substrate-binding domain-containing protein [Candidatus Acidoferrum sp.]|nr:LON peptidase substrate-binding domain-containing protein [Candidatus Acidoferrum sp.]